MATTAICTCGHDITFETDEEYYGLVRRHILPLAHEQHKLAELRTSRMGPGVVEPRPQTRRLRRTGPLPAAAR